MNKEVETGFLLGDKEAILTMGDYYMFVNGKEPVPHDRIAEFVGGWSPNYLHNIGEGWGMSTTDAIRCLYDTYRTTTFIKGVTEAVNVLKKRFPGEELVGIEAGCGTGILAVTEVLAGMDKVLALEINPTTAEYAQKFVDGLGLSDKIDIILADATKFQPRRDVHLLVSENMHTGLFLEPQVQIINNLRGSLQDGGIIIPRGVSLSFRLACVQWEKIRKEHVELRSVPEDEVMNLGTYCFLPVVDFSSVGQVDLIKGVVSVDGVVTNSLIVEMDVNVWDGLTIKSGQAEFLGQPHLVKIDPPRIMRERKYGFFYYNPGGVPPSKLELF